MNWIKNVYRNIAPGFFAGFVCGAIVAIVVINLVILGSEVIDYVNPPETIQESMPR